MNRTIKTLGIIWLAALAFCLCGCVTGSAGTSAGDNSTAREARSLLASLGRKVDDAKAAGQDPFAAIASIDGPWLDAAGVPVKFPLRRERVKRIVETFGGDATPVVPAVPAPPSTPPASAAGPAPADDSTPPRPPVPGIDP